MQKLFPIQTDFPFIPFSFCQMTFDLFVSRVIVPKRLEVIPATRNTDTNDACFIYLQKRSDPFNK